MTDLLQVWNSALGIGDRAEDLGPGSAILRAALVYIVTLLIVRLGKKRFMGRATAFDVIVGIILGSIVSRAITANAPLLPALVAAATIMSLHWLLSAAALSFPRFGRLIKGKPSMLIKNGVIDDLALRREHMTAHDIDEDLRGKSIGTADEVREARLERNGSLSILKTK